jgi:hypothetical protein
MAEAKTESAVTEQVREVTGKRGVTMLGVPISWVAIWGALLGVTSLIPVVIFVGSEGGNFPLSTALAPIVGLVLGPYGGFVAGLVGGTIGMFLNPAAYYMGVGNILDVAMAALVTGWIINKRWYFSAALIAAMALAFNIIPFYVLNIYTPPIDPAVHLAMWFYYVGLAVLCVTGWNILPKWIKGTNPAKMFVAGLILVWVGVAPGHLMGWIAFDVLYNFPIASNILVGTYIMPIQRIEILVLGALIGTAILVALRRAGLRKIPGAAW